MTEPMPTTASAPPAQKHREAILGALIVTVLWSSSWVIVRFGLDEEGLEPLTFAGLRYSVGAGVLWGVHLGRADRHREAIVGRAALGRLVVLGLVMYGLTQGSQFVAIDRQPAASTSLLLSMTPLVVAALAGLFLREPPSRRHFAGAILVAAGAGLYFGGALGATTAGMVAATVGLVSNSAASLLGRAENRRPETSPFTTTLLSMTVGAAALLAVGLSVEGIPSVSGRAVLVIAILGVVNTALAFTLWNHTLQFLSAPESAVINNTMLIQIAILGWVFLDETPDAVQILGIALVTIGILVATLRR